MNKELEQNIFDRDKVLFELFNKVIECEDGWFDLISQLTSTIIEGKRRGDIPIELKVVQIKEKFGGLRFYTTTTSNYMDGLIDLAEKLSYFICEFCGNKGKLDSKHGWWKTRCDTCTK